MENRALSILSRDTVFRLSFPHIAPGMEVHVLGLGLNHQTAGAVLHAELGHLVIAYIGHMIQYHQGSVDLFES